MGESVVFGKSKKFAVRIVNLYKYLRDEKHETVLSKQLLRSGTSIGANIAEVNLYIAFKECAESCHWLELLYTTDYLTK